MTNDEKKAVHLAQIRHAQEAIHGAVNDLRNARPGLSFQSAWAAVQQNRPELFDDLDKASEELSKITQGPDYDSYYEQTPAGKAPNNVPDEPGSKPPGKKADDPRARGFPQYVPRPKDPRIKVQGVTSLPRLRFS
jgi:hypothetical protein